MTEVIRSLATRIGGYFNSIRSARRHYRRVPISVSILGKTDASSQHPVPPLVGYTSDMSETGISLIVPTIRIGTYYLTGEGCTLLVRMELPAGEVQVHAVAQRYERLEDEAETRYVIGVRISEISAEDRTRFVAFLEGSANAATLVSSALAV